MGNSIPLKTAAAALLLFAATQAAAAAQARNVERCLSYAEQLDLGAPLQHTRALLRRSGSITIVAFGSSSSVGFGTFDPSYPQVLKAALARAHPSLHVKLISSGRVGETILGNVARLDKGVLRFRPDLVIWQLGTNDVLWHGIAPNTETLLRGAVRRLRQADADVILLDLQYAPALRRRALTPAMERIIATVAREEYVGLFSRFALMKQAIKGGVGGLVSWDGLHNSGAGYRCIGLALVDMLESPH